MTDIDEARAAIAHIRATEQRLSQRTVWPFWRHLVVGLALAVLMIGQTLDGGASVLVSIGVLLCALYLQNHDKERHGMFVNGWTRGPTLWVSFALLALAVGACLYVNIAMAEPQREQPVFWALLAATVVGGTAASYLWQHVYRRDLQGRAQ